MNTHYFDTIPSASRLLNGDEDEIPEEDILLTSQQKLEKYMKAQNGDNGSDDSTVTTTHSSTETTASNSPSLSSSESANLNIAPHVQHYVNPSPSILDRFKQLKNISLNSSIRRHNVEIEHENEMVIFDNDDENNEDENNNTINNDNQDANCSRFSKRSANLNLHAVDKHLIEPNSSTCLMANDVDNERDDAQEKQLHQRHHSASNENPQLKHNTSSIICMEKVNNQNLNSNDNSLKKTEKQKSDSGKSYFIVFILFIVNCLNYIDRFTIAGILRDIQDYYKINDGQAGLLQTVFICSYMLLAPLFGYLGDRFSRKNIIIFGIFFWSVATLAGSFVPQDKFWLFALIRSLVGIGEASYSCVAPTIIGDLFTGEMRTKMLGVFFIAVPFGSGLGYIVGSKVAAWTGAWQWALRVTPPMGLISIIILIFLVDEPKRGGAEASNIEESKTSFIGDTIYLLKNKTFMWTTMGFTFCAFVMGGLSWWVPIYIETAILSLNETPKEVPLIFGVTTCIGGLLGVIIAGVVTPKFRKVTGEADPLLCAIGSLLAIPLLFFAILIPRMVDLSVLWILIFFSITSLCLCWTVVADITLYVCEPNKRSMANAMNILICHLLGDAISPYILGAISDALRSQLPDTHFNRFTSLQYALYSAPCFATLSFAAYLAAALYVKQDRAKVDKYIKSLQDKLKKSDSESESNELSVEIHGFENKNYNKSNSNTFANLTNA